MEQEDFNLIIGQIEEDLKNLQSAKDQVEKVISSNVEFAKSSSSLIDNTKSLLSDVKNQNADALLKFAKQLAQTKKDLDNLASQSQGRIDTNISDFASKADEVAATAKSLLSDVKKQNADALSNFVKQLAQTKKDLDNLASKVQENIDTSVSDFANKADDVAKTAKSALEKQMLDNLKTLNQILETHNNIKQLIGQLLALEIPETLKNINNNLEKINGDILDFKKELVKIETNNQIRFQTTKILQISTLAITGIFGILIVLKLFGVL